MIRSFWIQIYFLRSRHGGSLFTQKSKLSAIKNSFGLGYRGFENKIDSVDSKILSQSNRFSRSKDFSQSKWFVTKLSILRVSILKIIIILLGPRMVCPIPMIMIINIALLGPRMICPILMIMISSTACSAREWSARSQWLWLSVLPARLENDLSDLNDYQYCQLGLKMCCLIYVGVEKLGRYLGIQKIMSASRNTLIGPSRLAPKRCSRSQIVEPVETYSRIN